MKTRHSTLWLLAAVLTLVALLTWLASKPSLPPSPLLTESNAPSPQAGHVGTGRGQPGIDSRIGTNVETAQPPNVPAASRPPVQTKAERMKEGLAALNDEDVVLYGRVLDQFGSPVVGASVSGVIQVNNGTRVGTDRMSTATDANGLFSITGHTGKNLGISITKTGYVLATTTTSFVYSHLWPEAERHVPDQNNPVVFRMWKLQGAEPLVGIDQHYKLPYAKAPVCFDLLENRIVSDGGDLRITVDRPDGIISQQHPQNWKIHLEIIGGGFILTSPAESRVTYSAPQNGYQRDGIFGNNNGPDVVEHTLFVKSREGKVYAKLYLMLGVNKSPGGLMDVVLRGAASTNGSGNWEATAPQQQ